MRAICPFQDHQVIAYLSSGCILISTARSAPTAFRMHDSFLARDSLRVLSNRELAFQGLQASGV